MASIYSTERLKSQSGDDVEMGLTWVGIGAIAGLCTAGVTVLSFWIAFTEKIATAKAKAEAAEAMAEDAKRDAENIQTQLAAHVGTFAMFREHIAKEYIDRDALESMEKRIMNGLKEIGMRVDKVLQQQHRPGGR